MKHTQVERILGRLQASQAIPQIGGEQRCFRQRIEIHPDDVDLVLVGAMSALRPITIPHATLEQKLDQVAVGRRFGIALLAELGDMRQSVNLNLGADFLLALTV